VKITNLSIKNFRGIKLATLDGLTETVVVAGANGSGKSCVFDAIRLIKSCYGGYQDNELQQWAAEFQLPIENGRIDFRPMLNDKASIAEISCQIQLHPTERTNLRDLGESNIRNFIASEPRSAPMPLPLAGRTLNPLLISEEEIEEKTALRLATLNSELSKDALFARILITIDGGMLIENSIALEILFSTYRPHHIGLIDYHGPQRFFQREILQNLNINLVSQIQQRSQQSLYNYAGKYQNVKAELASGYVQDIIAQRAGVGAGLATNLTETLQELFATFFPDKHFAGPVPSGFGTIEFPVTSADGSKHDLNELSAGEKEVLYGYLRIRNSAPRYSIILLDEPELHLNPRLIKYLPAFYTKHLGRALDNQIWLVTHSDALIREVVSRPEYSLFHMTPPQGVISGESQAKRVNANEGVEGIVVDLVGDLATYRPGGKVVIFEGGGSTDFDVALTQKLFPDMLDQINCISGGGRVRVGKIHEILDRAASTAKIPFKIYSVCDLDSGRTGEDVGSRFTWDVYHVENYLLEPLVISEVLRSLGISMTWIEVHEGLRACARDTMGGLIQHRLVHSAGANLTSALNLSFDPKAPDVAKALREAIERSIDRVKAVASGSESLVKLREAEASLRSSFEKDLVDDRWMSNFKGRDILTQFADRYGNAVGYVPFRNLIIDRFVEANYRPVGMGRVLAKILAD
jgi:hypothetical protein